MARPKYYANTNDPFLIPDKHPLSIQFSGGRTSAFMLYKIIERNNGLPDNARVMFQNTGREMDETLNFVEKVGQEFGVNIIWLEYSDNKQKFEIVGHNSASRNGEPFDKLIKKRKYPPNVVTRFCSDELKYRTAKRYLVANGVKRYYSAIGFRADEGSRVKKIRGRHHSREVIWTPLYDAGLSVHDVKDFWDNQAGFDLQLDNIKGNTPLGNCDGCFLKSEANLANLCKHYPGRYDWWERQEKKLGKTFNKSWSREDLRKSVEAQSDLFEEFEELGVFCDAIHGTCETY